MSYQALARKWRPKTFAQVIGQAHVVAALANGLDSQRVHHAFLFAGTRGVGKTTLARIFAKALNCEQGVSSKPCGECTACRGVDGGNFIDLIEVDAASRTRVDDTRELLDNVQYTPTQGRFKIYLIDEVHMLSTHSFNALLKTLEEPPAHVKFLLATTDPQKLPTTILSRCLQFNLRAMDLAPLTAQLERILKAEEIDYEPAALQILARSADGSVRDALSLLDQGIVFGNGAVKTKSMRAMLGMIDDQLTRQLLTQICGGQTAQALDTVADMAMRAADFGHALDEILTLLHNVSLCQVSPQAVQWKGVDAADLAELTAVEAELLQLMYQIALIGKRDLPLAPDPRSGFEMVVLRMLAFRPQPVNAAEARPLRRVAPAKPTMPAAPAAPVTTKSVAATIAEPGATNHGFTSPGTGNTAGNAAGNAAAPPAAPKTAQDAARRAADSGAKPDLSLAQLGAGAGWEDFIKQSGLRGLRGLPREIMMHAAVESVLGNTLNLTVEAKYEHLLEPARLKKIEQHLASRLAQPVKLQVTVGQSNASAAETPSQRQHRAQQETQQAAVQAFNDDPKVQELVDRFEAEVVDDSIRPPKA